MRRAAWNRSPRLEMMPLIDVVFLLLAVFIYAMVSMVRSYVLPVDLPTLATGEERDLPAVLVVSVERDGSLWVAGERARLPELVGRVRELRAREAGLSVLVNADAAARHGDVVRVFDCLRTAGQERVLIVGKPDDGSASL